jgi:hypothetical protein
MVTWGFAPGWYRSGLWPSTTKTLNLPDSLDEGELVKQLRTLEFDLNEESNDAVDA